MRITSFHGLVEFNVIMGRSQLSVEALEGKLLVTRYYECLCTKMRYISGAQKYSDVNCAFYLFSNYSYS